MESELTELERKAFEIALSGNSKWLEILRAQVPMLKVVSREYTGVGFYTNVICTDCVASTEQPPPDSLERVPVAWAAHPEVDDGGKGVISFHVFSKDGVITFLEGVSTSSWPETEERITF